MIFFIFPVVFPGYVWHLFARTADPDQTALIVPVFQDVSAAAGLADTTSSYAAAAADVDGDGDFDIALSLHGLVHFYRNQGDGSFAEPTFIGGSRGRDIHGVSFIDFNHDGRPDLATTRGANRGRGVKTNEYYNNTGSDFELLQNLSPVLADSIGRGRSITPVDINNDGLTDMILMNFYAPQRPHRVAVAQARSSTQYLPIEINKAFSALFSTGIISVDIDNDGADDYISQRANGRQKLAVFSIEPNGNFTDKAESFGLGDIGRVFTAVPLDYDNDGDMDLFLARGRREPPGAQYFDNQVLFRYPAYNKPRKSGFRIPVRTGHISLSILFEGRPLLERLYLGKQRRPATESLLQSLAADSPVLRGNPQVNPETDMGGFLWRNRNGMLIYEFVGRRGILEGSAGLLTLSGEHGTIVRQSGTSEGQAFLPHLLYRNDNGIFTDVTPQSGIAGPGDAYDAIAADFNNDGFLDIYIVGSGEMLRNRPNHLYLNNRDGAFTDATQETRAEGPDTGSGNGSIAFDYDLDGDIDLFIYNGAGGWPAGQGPLALLKNNLSGTNQAVFIDLIGTRSNTRGWGSRMTAYIGGQTVPRRKFALTGHLSTSDLPIHLGLGTAAVIDSLSVRWPAGHDTTLYRIPAGARLTIIEN